mmetsp:Transcript_106321/g.195184  ORF Transcript_106321/g.195184 Transcript_106321/m.195184 type:complete len:652 (+) Transcript_106321:35-1990(+)
MAALQGRRVTIAIPEDAPPGTLLSIPISGGEPVKLRVPPRMGPGSTLALTQLEGSEDWDVEVASLVPLAEEEEQRPDVGPQESYDDVQQRLAREWEFQQQQQQQQETYEEQQQRLAKEWEMQQQQQHQELTRSQQEEESWQLQMQQEQLRQQRQQEERVRQQLVQQEQLVQQAPQSAVEPPVESPADVAVAYTVRLETTVGVMDIIIRPDWAPLGAKRFLELVAAGDLNNLSFYRAIEGCIAQFGLPAKRKWEPIPDDPPTGVPFLLGAVSFAAVGENSRKSTLFICTGDMSHCLGHNTWETPIGAVAESSLDVLDKIDTTYGDIAEFNGNGPDTSRINSEGEAYLRAFFPRLTYITKAWPLDWEPENPQDVTSPSAAAAAVAAGLAGLESSSPEAVTDQAMVAARAAEEAQEMAARAAQLAATATTAEHARAAMEAAKNASRAAQQAQEAAAAAQAAADSTRRANEALPMEQATAARLPPADAATTVGHLTGYTHSGAVVQPPPVQLPAGQHLAVRPGSSLRMNAGPLLAPQGMVASRTNSRQVSQVAAYPTIGQLQPAQTQPVLQSSRAGVTATAAPVTLTAAAAAPVVRFTQQVQQQPVPKPSVGGSIQFPSTPGAIVQSPGPPATTQVLHPALQVVPTAIRGQPFGR